MCHLHSSPSTLIPSPTSQPPPCTHVIPHLHDEQQSLDGRDAYHTDRPSSLHTCNSSIVAFSCHLVSHQAQTHGYSATPLEYRYGVYPYLARVQCWRMQVWCWSARPVLYPYGILEMPSTPGMSDDNSSALQLSFKKAPTVHPCISKHSLMNKSTLSLLSSNAYSEDTFKFILRPIQNWRWRQQIKKSKRMMTDCDTLASLAKSSVCPLYRTCQTAMHDPILLPIWPRQLTLSGDNEYDNDYECHNYSEDSDAEDHQRCLMWMSVVSFISQWFQVSDYPPLAWHIRQHALYDMAISVNLWMCLKHTFIAGAAWQQ